MTAKLNNYLLSDLITCANCGEEIYEVVEEGEFLTESALLPLGDYEVDLDICGVCGRSWAVRDY